MGLLMEKGVSEERPKGTASVQIDNARLRVTLWSFAPGAATGFHRHAHDYCVVPLATGRLRIEEAGKESEAALTAGRAYYREAGVEHDVINANPFDFAFVEIELKEPRRRP
jgi:beta-alanine degradation protein BauB